MDKGIQVSRIHEIYLREPVLETWFMSFDFIERSNWISIPIGVQLPLL